MYLIQRLKQPASIPTNSLTVTFHIQCDVIQMSVSYGKWVAYHVYGFFFFFLRGFITEQMLRKKKIFK